MKKFITLQILIICILFFISALFAQDYYSNANRPLYAFPEFSSTGSSALAFARDASPLSNPANIPLDLRNSISLAYTGFYENCFSTTLASFVTNLNEHIGIGMYMGYLYIPDIEVTSGFELDNDGQPIYDPSLLSMKTSSELFFNFAFGYKFKITPVINASAGASLHCQRRRLIDWTGYGIGVDAGTTLELQRPGLRFSLLLDDITTNYIHWSSDYHENGLPHARLGIGWRKEIPYIYGRLSIMYKSPDLFSNEGVGYNYFSEKAGNVTEPEKHNVKDDPTLLFSSGSYGFEYLIQRVVALRVGLDEPKRIFFGAGVGLFRRSLFFDFAYMVSYELPGTYSLSTSYNW